jgi:signal transduction histidine kinase
VGYTVAMSIQESFVNIRPTLQKRVARSLARGVGVRENFNDQLSRFFDLLEDALVSGDAAWLDALLHDWSATRTQTDLEAGERNISALLNQIATLTLETARESLGDSDALDLANALTPVYLHCIEQATVYEHESRIEYLSGEVKRLQTKVERLDKTKSNFISVAAHELKTPLTLIEGYTAMIGDLVPADLNQIQALVHGVHNGIRRLREIVDDMIDVSIIDNGLLDLNFQPLWVNRILDLLKAEFLPRLEERRQILDIKPFEGNGELVFADPERIYQAFHNILSNAIKYTPDGGQISIGGRLLPGFVEVTISDTGIGIAAENLDLIFEKFGSVGDISLHSSGKTKFKGGGPGLGLAITKGIIEAHGGSLWVESAGYDEVRCPGSTFHLLLPLRTQPNDPHLAKMFGLGQYSAGRPSLTGK